LDKERWLRDQENFAKPQIPRADGRGSASATARSIKKTVVQATDYR